MNMLNAVAVAVPDDLGDGFESAASSGGSRGAHGQGVTRAFSASRSRITHSASARSRSIAMLMVRDSSTLPVHLYGAPAPQSITGRGDTWAFPTFRRHRFRLLWPSVSPATQVRDPVQGSGAECVVAGDSESVPVWE